MFTKQEIKQAMLEESKGTAGHQPLKFLVAPKDEPRASRPEPKQAVRE